MPDLVNARWVAGYRAELPDKTALVPGETVVEIARGEAEASDNWEVVEKAAERAKPPTPTPTIRNES